MRKHLIGALVTALAAAPLTVAAVTALSSPATAAPAQQHTWKNVEIQGGGFVPGIVFSQAQKDLIYARTDIGGMYRWNQATNRWVPLLDWVGNDRYGYNGVVSVAADPVDASNVYAAVGMYTTSWDPNPGAIIRSSDKGATWQVTPLPFKLGGNMPGRGMGERLAIDPNKTSTLYFGAPSGKGLWRSTDSGATWAAVTAFPNVGNYVADPANEYSADIQGVVWVQFDKSSGSAGTASKTIYVGVADKANSIYRSLDAGVTWSRVAGQPTGFLPHKAVIDTVGNVMYLAYSDTGGPYDGGKGAVWKYDLTTGAWTDISPVPAASSDAITGYSGLTIDRQKPGTLIVGTQVSWWPDAQFWRTTDGGATWSKIWEWSSYPSRSFKYKQDITEVPWLNFGVTQPVAPDTAPKLGWMNESIEIDPFNSDRFLYGTGATIYGSTDLTKWDSGGQLTIKPVVAGLEETAVLDLISPPSGAPLVSALGDIGGFVHPDLTEVPSTMFTGPAFTSTRSLDYAELKPEILVRAGDFSAADRPNDHHVAFSSDSGKTWFQASAEPSGVNSGGTIAASSDGQRFVWAPGDAGQQVVVSEGLGYQWKPAAGVPAQSVIESDRVNPKKFYAFSGGTFYVSTDGGVTFTKSPAAGLPAWAKFKAVPGKEGDLWLAGSGGLWHSTDSGASFTKLSTVADGVNVGFGKAAPGASYQALYLIGTVDGVYGAFRSDTAGASWVRINDDQHQYGNWGEAITGDPRVYGRVYVGTNGRGIVYADPTGSVTTTPVTTTPTTTTPTTTPTTTTPTTTTPSTTTTRPTTTTPSTTTTRPTTTTPSTTTTGVPGSGFSIRNGRLFESNGQEFVIRGVNHAHTWYSSQTSSFAAIKAAGANSVRVVLSGGRWSANTAADVANVISLCKANKLICVLENHDTTGFQEQAGATSLDAAANYWVSLASVLKGQEKYVIINIGNEPWGNTGHAGWTAATQGAIKKLRAAGFTHTIMVDAPNWGQDWSFTMRDNAPAVFAADPLANTIFSVHMYGVFDTAAEVKAYLDSFTSRGLPILVGEFGDMHSDGNPDENTIMSYTRSQGLGMMGWSWSGNGGGVEYLDMTTNFNPAALTPWGQRFINGADGLKLGGTKEASVFSGVVTTTPTTTTPTTTTPSTTTTRPTTTTPSTTTTRPTTTTPSTTTTRPTTTTPSTTTTRPTTTTPSTTTTRPTSTATTASGKTCSAAYKVVGQWPGGFQGEVTVTAGSSAITAWKVSWTFANGQVVQQSWAARLTQSASTVTGTNVAWNGGLGASASTTVGFLGSFAGTNSVPTVTCSAS